MIDLLAEDAAAPALAPALDNHPRWHPLALCEDCALYRERIGRCRPFVRGEGPAQADVVIVGEAPGKTEVAMGHPFYGESGHLLDRALRAAGLARKDVYVTNAAACHPDGNKTPAMASVKACQPRLLEEIRQRRPRVVVVLGNTALAAVGILDKITGARGRERWVSVEQLDAAVRKGRRVRDLPRVHFDPDWRDGGVYVLPTFHPAYALRNPDVYPDIEKDLRRAAELVRAEPARQRAVPTPHIHTPTSVKDALRWVAVLGQQTVVAADIESTGIDLFRDELTTLAYAWQDATTREYHALVLPAFVGELARVHPSWAAVPRHLRGIGQNRLVRAALRDFHRSKVRVVWWNGKFDRKWYKKLLGVPVRIDGDGMLAHYATDERRGIHGLKERASDDLGANDYEVEIKQFTGRGAAADYGAIPYENLVVYTATDVAMTLPLTLQYEAELQDDPHAAWVYQHILLAAAPVLSDVELAGVTVDVALLRSLNVEFYNQPMLPDGTPNAFYDAAQPAGLLDRYEGQMRAACGSTALNVASYPQLVQVLYGPKVREQYGATAKTADTLPTFGLPVQLNDRKTPGTGADACDKILARPDTTMAPAAREFLLALRSHRQFGQLHKTYVRKLPDAVRTHNRIHSGFNLHTTRTGRLSSSEPVNLQNIPVRTKMGKRIKDAFVARPGYLLWEVDMSQAELRTAAFLSSDPIMRGVYLDGRDFHQEVGEQLLGSAEKAKELRPFIKTFNFALLYGAQDRKLTQLLNDVALEEEQRAAAEGRVLTMKRWQVHEVARLAATFRQKFPTFNRWALMQRRHAEREQWVISYFGRKRRWHLITRDLLEDVKKEAVNHPVQSTASDIVLLGLIQVHWWLRADPRRGRVLLTVHDSIVGESPADQALATAQHVKNVLESVPAQHGIDLPFVADIKIGQRWGSLEEVKEVRHG